MTGYPPAEDGFHFNTDKDTFVKNKKYQIDKTFLNSLQARKPSNQVTPLKHSPSTSSNMKIADTNL